MKTNVGTLAFKSIGKLDINDAIMESEHEDGCSSIYSGKFQDSYVVKNLSQVTDIESEPPTPRRMEKSTKARSGEYIEIVCQKAY